MCALRVRVTQGEFIINTMSAWRVSVQDTGRGPRGLFGMRSLDWVLEAPGGWGRAKRKRRCLRHREAPICRDGLSVPLPLLSSYLHGSDQLWAGLASVCQIRVTDVSCYPNVD